MFLCLKVYKGEGGRRIEKGLLTKMEKGNFKNGSQTKKLRREIVLSTKHMDIQNGI